MIPNPAESNRRLHARLEPRRTTRAALTAGGLYRDRDLAAATLSVTESAACLVLTAPLPEQQEVALTLQGLGYPRPTCFLGKVAWCEPVGTQWVAHIHLQKRLDPWNGPSVN